MNVKQGFVVCVVGLTLQATMLLAQSEIQMSVLSGTNAQNVFTPGQAFQFELRPNLISGSAPGDLAYQWIDYQGNTLTSPQALVAGVSNTVTSPSASMDIGYYGLQFLGTNTTFNPQTNHRPELGFSVLPAITSRTVAPNSFFGMVQQDYQDPYLDPGYIKTRTNAHAFNPTTNVVNAASWQSQIGARYAQGQLEIPVVNAAPWISSDATPIPQSQLNDLESMFQQYMTADNRVPAWELGLEEQLGGGHGTYYWENLREKFKAFNSARDTVFPSGDGPELGYQVVNYSSSWINQLFSSPSTDPGGASAGDEIDFIGLHPYDWNDFRDAEQWHDTRFNAMKSQLTGFGKQDLPIWYTEGGAPINDANVPTMFSGANQVPVPGRSRADHPQFLVKLHLEALDAGVEHFTWYNYQDRFADDTNVEAHFGLIDFWDFPKPSYTAYANMVNSLKGLDFTGSEVLPSGVSVYRFTDGTDETLVAWSAPGASNSVDFSTLFGGPAPGQVASSNIVGTPLAVAGSSFQLGDEPVFFKAADTGGGPGGGGASFQVNLEVQGHTTFDANNTASTDFIDPAPDGVPALQDINHQWTYHTGTSAGSTTALLDVDGNATGATFKLINAVSHGSRSNSSLGGSAPFDDVARDHVHIPAGGDVEWEISGLATDGTTYDLYVIAANIWNGGWTDILVTHDGGTDLKQLTNSSFGGSVQYTGGPLGLHGHYEEFMALLPNASGVISGIVRDYNDGAAEKYFSGLQLVSHSVQLLGDFNGDGTVDAADYTVWRDHEGDADESSLNGNGDGLGGVDMDDYALWRDNYGNSSSQSNSESVPEPTALFLVLSATSLLGIRRRGQAIFSYPVCA